MNSAIPTPAVWPAALPQLMDRPGFSERPFWPSVAFQPETGKPITRPAGTVRMSEIECSITCDARQVEIFEEFVWRDCGQGHLPFSMRRPRTGEWTVFSFDVEGGQPFEIQPVSGITWRISFTLLAAAEEG